MAMIIINVYTKFQTHAMGLISGKKREEQP